MNEENFVFYDWVHKKDPTRWEVSTHPRGWYGSDIQFAQSLSPREKEQLKIIDLGCGNGRSLDAIQTLNPTNFWELYGIDFSPMAVRLAEVKLQGKAKLQVGDITKLNFPDRTFDYVLSCGTHEHLDPIDFSEPARILKKDGMFLALLPVVSVAQGKVWYDTCYSPGNWGKHFEWLLTIEDWRIHLLDYFEEVVYQDSDAFYCKKPKDKK